MADDGAYCVENSRAIHVDNRRDHGYLHYALIGNRVKELPVNNK